MITELQIINTMLAAKGIAPVSSPDSQHPEVQAAKAVFSMVNMEVQEKGWWFNREYNFPLAPDLSGEIIIPGDTMSVDPVDSQSRLIRRNGKLYDPVQHTYNIGELVRVNLTLLLPVSDLPNAFAQYVMHESAARFYLDGDADLQKANALQSRSTKAYERLNQAALSAMDVNSRTSPHVARLFNGVQGAGGRYRPDRPGGR